MIFGKIGLIKKWRIKNVNIPATEVVDFLYQADANGEVVTLSTDEISELCDYIDALQGRIDALEDSVEAYQAEKEVDMFSDNGFNYEDEEERSW